MSYMPLSNVLNRQYHVSYEIARPVEKLRRPERTKWVKESSLTRKIGLTILERILQKQTNKGSKTWLFHQKNAVKPLDKRVSVDTTMVYRDFTPRPKRATIATSKLNRWNHANEADKKGHITTAGRLALVEGSPPSLAARFDPEGGGERDIKTQNKTKIVVTYYNRSYGVQVQHKQNKINGCLHGIVTFRVFNFLQSFV